MDIQNGGFLSIEQLKDRYLGATGKNTTPEKSDDKVSFQSILEEKSRPEVRFSKHAAVRLKERGIDLSQDQMDRLAGGIRKAQLKGIKDSLVMVDELAFIVNVPNQTVVTAMDSSNEEENVFTNINGAVIS